MRNRCVVFEKHYSESHCPIIADVDVLRLHHEEVAFIEEIKAVAKREAEKYLTTASYKDLMFIEHIFYEADDYGECMECLENTILESYTPDICEHDPYWNLFLNNYPGWVAGLFFLNWVAAIHELCRKLLNMNCLVPDVFPEDTLYCDDCEHSSTCPRPSEARFNCEGKSAIVKSSE